VTDITGTMPLAQFIAFIQAAGGLVAASTGPLHIAAALGKVAVGLYAPMRPIHPGRWAPLGPRSGFLVVEKECQKCRHDTRCECIENIRPADVALKLEQLTAR
jgi:ADP-heptose:LPS heptosyltransferase